MTIATIAGLLAQFGPSAIQLIDHLFTLSASKQEVTIEEWTSLKAKINIPFDQLSPPK